MTFIRAQCNAFKPDGEQCRRTAQPGAKYCHSHRAYRPKDVVAGNTRPDLEKLAEGLSIDDILSAAVESGIMDDAVVEGDYFQAPEWLVYILVKHGIVRLAPEVTA